MASIDLYEDFNELEDARYGDLEEDSDAERPNVAGSDQENENGDQNDPENGKQEVDAGIKVKKPKRKLVTLNAERLKGPRGIIAIDDFYKNIKLKGKGYEKEDLNEVMKRLEYWSHRMFPKYHFDDSLTKIEKLGRKKEIALHMTRYRLGQLVQEDENQVQSDNEDNDRLEDTLANELPVDEFEDMLNQQIALSNTTHRNTTTNNDSSMGNLNMSSVSTSTQIYNKKPSSTQSVQSHDTYSQPKYPLPSQDLFSQLKASDDTFSQPKPSTPQLTDEQKVRIEENKKKAMAIRAAKMKEIEDKKLKEAEDQKLKEQEEQKSKEATRYSINMEIDDDFC